MNTFKMGGVSYTILAVGHKTVVLIDEYQNRYEWPKSVVERLIATAGSKPAPISGVQTSGSSDAWDSSYLR